MKGGEGREMGMKERGKGKEPQKAKRKNNTPYIVYRINTSILLLLISPSSSVYFLLRV